MVYTLKPLKAGKEIPDDIIKVALEALDTLPITELVSKKYLERDRKGEVHCCIVGAITAYVYGGIDEAMKAKVTWPIDMMFDAVLRKFESNDLRKTHSLLINLNDDLKLDPKLRYLVIRAYLIGRTGRKDFGTSNGLQAHSLQETKLQLEAHAMGLKHNNFQK